MAASYSGISNSFPDTSIVEITLVSKEGVLEQASGIVIAPDYILTAAHVTDDAASITVLTNNLGMNGAYDVASNWTSLTNYAGLTSLTYAQSAGDLGLIQLSDPTTATPLSLEPNYLGGVVSVVGFPGGYLGGQSESEQVLLDSKAADLQYHNGDVLPGNSGGALLDGSLVVGVVSTTGAAAAITPADQSWMSSWMSQTQQTANFQITGSDPTMSGIEQGQALTPGGPTYLASQYTLINSGTVHALTDNAFLISNTTQSVLVAAGGQNVLDALSGSNILVGGTGADGGSDAFFIDDANGGVWNAVANFHPGDNAAVWDFKPGQSFSQWYSDLGAPGYSGATLATAQYNGGPMCALTFAGMSVDQVKAQCSFSYGHDAGTGKDYMLISNHG